MSKELIPHVDKQGTLLGIVTRSRAYAEGLVHMGAHGFMRRADGKILIQRRNTTKASWPGCYDLSIAETVKPDESFEAALVRGLVEELGVTSPLSLELVREKYYQEYRYQSYLINGVICLYVFEYEGEIKIDEDEVMESRFMTVEEIDNLVQSSPELCTPWLVVDWQFFRS